MYAVFNIADSILYHQSGGALFVNTAGCPALPNPYYPWDANCFNTIGNQDLYAIWYVLHLIDSITAGGGGVNANWKLLGNTGTNPATNFLGTLDTATFNLRVHNIFAGAISPQLFNSSFGQSSANAWRGNNNSSLGYNANGALTTGNFNTAIGDSANYGNADPDNYNTAVGASALAASGGNKSSNVALGYKAGRYWTLTNGYFLNNQDRTDVTGDTTKSLLYGKFNATATNQRLRLNGHLMLVDGTQGANKLLQSDANGNASWQTINVNPDFKDSVPKYAWGLKGNSGTSAGTNFLGTTDNVDLVFKTNNIERVRIFSNSNLLSENNSFWIYQLSTDTAHNTRKDANVIGGDSAGFSYKGTTAYRNTAWGNQALFADTSLGNTGIGFNAGHKHKTGNDNTFIGVHCFENDLTGISNTGCGGLSGINNTSGQFLTFIGFQTGQANTTGNTNTAVGYQALYANATGSSNTSLGAYTLQGGTCNNNVAVGYGVLNNSSSDNNSCMGGSSLQQLTSGGANTTSGYQSGYGLTSLSNSVLLGAYTNATNGVTNAIAIGYNTTVTASNQMVLGNGVNVGIGTSNPLQKLDVVGSIKMTDGNQAAGSYLSGDVNGVASWSAFPVFGQTTLVSGTIAITITGVSASSIALVTLVTPSGTTLTTAYQAVCTTNTVTLQANIAAGTINTADGSTLNYEVKK